MTKREWWTAVYKGAHFGCMVCLFALAIGPAIAFSVKPHGRTVEILILGVAAPIAAAIVCGTIGNIAWRLSGKSEDDSHLE